MINKPESNEYHEFYAGYVAKVIDEDIRMFLENQNQDICTFLKNVLPEKVNYAYSEGKWTIKQLVRHLVDAERVFGYRAMCIARKDTTKLPGFDEGDYMEAADDSKNSYHDLIHEFESLRVSNIRMIDNFTEQCFTRVGNANGSDISVRAIIYIMAGHVAHHKKIIQERYL